MGVNETTLFSKSRFTIVLLFLLINLATFALLRVALLIKQLADIDSSFDQIALAFLMGGGSRPGFFQLFVNSICPVFAGSAQSYLSKQNS